MDAEKLTDASRKRRIAEAQAEREADAAELTTLRQQRDALLEAANEAEALMAKSIYPKPDKPNSDWGTLVRLRDAIALCTPAPADQ